MNAQSPLNRRPAVRFALLLIGGILFAQIVPTNIRLLFPLALIFLLSGVIAWLWLKMPSISGLCLSASIFLVGTVLASMQQHVADDLRLNPSGYDEPISLEAKVASKPAVHPSQVRFTAETRWLRRSDSTLFVPRRVIVSVRKEKEAEGRALRVGSILRVNGVLEPFPLPRNPGEFNYGRYLDLNGIQGIIYVRSWEDLQVLEGYGYSAGQRILDNLRSMIAETLDRLHGVEQSSFLKGILLADRGEISPDLKQSFVDTGTIHVLAVSGLHVGIVAVVFYALFGLLRFGRRAIIFLTIAGLFVYMLLTGSTPSVIRATIMASIILLGQVFERRGDIYNSLSVAAIIILLWDPRQLFNVGFQLSFAAVLSIVALYPILANLIKKIPERFEEIKAIDYVLKLFAVSLAAQLGTLPFTAFYFERISVVSLLANLIVVPVVGLNVTIGFASLAAALFSNWIAQCYAALNNVLVSFLLGFVKAASSVPFAFVETSHLTAQFPLCYYVGIVGVFYVGHPRVRNRACIVGLIILNAFLFHDVFGSRKPSLRFTALDVGQGDALFIEFPNNRTMLVDAGPKTFSYDAGKNIIVPFLKRRGTDQLDAVVISHPHSDHMGGLPYVLEHIRVGRLIVSAANSTSNLSKEIQEKAQAAGIPFRVVSVGDTIVMDRSTRIYVLHPLFPVDSTANLNNTSVVLKLLYGQTSFLLPGDAEEEAERKIVKRYGPLLGSDVLKAGHHGSITSSSSEFLGRVRPRFAIISVGRNNKFRHPSQVVIERMQRISTGTIRTDQEAAVVLQSDGYEVKRSHWRY